MQKEFEEAAFKLNKGEVSTLVDTASGVHLIQRSGPRHYCVTIAANSCATGWNSSLTWLHGVYGVKAHHGLVSHACRGSSPPVV
jgi:hypothetical protein